ncbi:MAG: PIN domain-containing protein [Chthoniobacteraceae bacterium]
MISIDTNVLFAALVTSNAQHEHAVSFLDTLADEEVAISELVLLELYNLLRNPTVLTKPLTASAAVDVCEAFRQHPRWQLLGFPPDSRIFHEAFWPRLREKNFARRRSYNWRLTLSLLRQGVTEFATVNIKDFDGLGFARVWNPLGQ